MAAYDINGNVISDTNYGNNCVFITDLKTANPLYTDDQLLDIAIVQAKALGENAIIIWDGSDIHFTGETTHICKGFGGIDFNGSVIYMPNYDQGTILQIVPDETEDITVSASDIYKDRTTESALIRKVFTLDDGGTGNADMCLGNRIYSGGSSSVLYWRQTIITDNDGKYKTGELYLVPEIGNVPCKNVHDYPAVTFEVCNGTIISYSSQSMTNFVVCTRSNVCVHNFVLGGVSSITSFHKGIFTFEACCNIEIYNLYGESPVQKALTSGYVMGCSCITSLHAHDIYLGDSTRWGVIACHYLHNSVIERCNLNRFDCHYAQTGINVVRDCVLGFVQYGVGNGKLIIENCIIKNEADDDALIKLRSDCVGVFNGDVILKNCIFYTGKTQSNTVYVWYDRCWNQKPQNSVLTGAPLAKRVVDNCTIIDGCTALLHIGTAYSSDKSLYSNMVIEIKDTDINVSDCIVSAPDTLLIKKVMIANCAINGDTLKSVECDLVVANSNLAAITSNITLPNVVAIGNIISGTQSTTSFAKYTMSGNIAADMESVNKYSGG